MGRLIKWFNIIIKKQKGAKRWQKVVTVMAAMITFATTYALILPAITVEKNSTEEVGGMYLEQTAEQDELLEENALEPTGVSIAADMDNAVTFACANDDLTATAVFSTDEIIPEGTELVVNLVDPASEEYAALRGRSEGLLDKEFIYDVTTCAFYDYALVCDNIDVTPKTGLVDIQIIFRNNTVEHVDDQVYAGRYARTAEEADKAAALAEEEVELVSAGEENAAVSAEDGGNRYAVDNDLDSSEGLSGINDELVAVNIDDSSVIELTGGIITSFSLKGNDLARDDSVVGILAGYVDEEIKAQVAETDAEIPDHDSSQEENASADSDENATANNANIAEHDEKEVTDALQVKTLKASGKDYTVTLTYDETSGIPEGADLTATEIAQDSEEYQTYLKETKKAMGLAEEEALPSFAARFFDIKIMVDGKEFTPETGVSVEITYTEPLAEYSETEVNAVHFADEKAEAEVIPANTAEVQDDGTATVEFTAESFSVYGVIYTVDFHWEVDGKTVEFSIPGGGFVSLEHIVEVLGIATGDENTENEAEKAENGADGEASPATGSTTYEETIKLNEAEVSEATKKFVADVEKVEFSSPELVWVGKVNETVTVGALKEANELKIEYSAELTEEQIAKINAQTVEAGDWALISMQPFSSEETLTVTMKNGESFVVKVTDYNSNPTLPTKEGDTVENVLIVTNYNHTWYALTTDGNTVPIGTTAEISNGTVDIDSLGREYLWNIKFGWKDNSGDYLKFSDVDNNDKYLNVNWYETNPANSVPLTTINTDGNAVQVCPANGGGYNIKGWQNSVLLFVNDETKFRNYLGSSAPYTTRIQIWQQAPKNTFNYTVTTDDYAKGYVTVGNSGHQAEISATTNSNKQNTETITAVPQTWRYKFDHWVLNEGTSNARTLEASSTITINTDPNGVISGQISRNGITIPFSGSTLTAYFVENPDWVPADDDEKEGRTYDQDVLDEWFKRLTKVDTPLDRAKTTKTAEVYDYENRVYRVDLNATSNLETFDATIDLGFIIDVSGSMKFPAKLMKYPGYGNYTSSDYVEFPVGQLNTDTYRNRLEGDGPYFIVTDKADTATVYRLERHSGVWYAFDASKSYGETSENGSGSSKRYRLDSTTNLQGDGTGALYQIYYDYDDPDKVFPEDPYGKQRLDYLNLSINNTITDLKQILAAVQIAADETDAGGDIINRSPDVKIAWNVFSNSIDNGNSTTQGQYTFDSANNTTPSLSFSTSGGTSTDIALLDAAGIWRDDVTGNKGYRTNSGSGGADYWKRLDSDRNNVRYYKKGTNHTGQSYYNNSISGFNWNSSDTKYAVLITDGAPQRKGNPVESGLVADAAKALKYGVNGNGGINNSSSDEINLITVGLSMGDVKRGSVLLYDIASPAKATDETPLPYFYKADNGDDLQYVLREILSAITVRAIVVGDVYDTVNEAFYPVDKITGTPLESGNVINLDGELLTKNNGVPLKESELSNAQKEAGYGVIREENNIFSVKWPAQEFSWDGWNGTLYEKSKEDFLGGNAIRTNGATAEYIKDGSGNIIYYKVNDKGEFILDDDGNRIIGTRDNGLPILTDSSAYVDALAYKVTPDGDEIPINKEKVDSGIIYMETPRVNVNELDFSQNDTEWTVYLGEKVKPIDELKKLFEKIEVYGVVTEAVDKDHRYTPDLNDTSKGNKDYYRYAYMESDSDGRDNDNTTKSQKITFKITDFIELSDDDWRSLIAGNTVPVPYSPYGTEDSAGTITVKLTKTHDPKEHATEVSGERVETYVLEVEFSPCYTHVPTGLGGTDPYPYHKGTNMNNGGSSGTTTGRETSVNNHIINVIEEQISFTKVEMGKTNKKLAGAKFRLYKETATGITLPGMDNSRKFTSVPLDNDYIVDETQYYKRVTEKNEDAIDLIEFESNYYWKLDNEIYIVKDNAAYMIASEGTEGAVQLEEDTTTWYKQITVDKIVDDYAYMLVAEAGSIDGITGVMSKNGVRYWILDPDKYKTDSDGRIYRKVAGGTVQLDESSDDRYEMVADIEYTSDANGNVAIDSIPILGEPESTSANTSSYIYYLAETLTPTGYISIPEPIKVILTVTDSYDNLPADNVYDDAKDNTRLQNRRQTSAITMDTTSGFVDKDGDNYLVLNNPGVELPSTGGPGLKTMYLFGFMMTGFAGAGFLMRRRKQRCERTHVIKK